MTHQDVLSGGQPGAAARCTLVTRWTPPTATERGRYLFTLTNGTGERLKGFRLAFCGPARIDLKAPAPDNALLLRRFSNFTEVAMLGDGVVEPGESWTFLIHGTQAPLRHFTDAARTSYVTLSNGKILPVDVGYSVSDAFGAGEPKFGYDEIGPLGDIVDGLALAPWPANVKVSGSRAAMPMSVATDGVEQAAAVNAFRDIAATVFPQHIFIGNGLQAIAVRLQKADLAAEAYRIVFGETVILSAAGEAGWLYGLITLGQILRGAWEAPDACRFPETGQIDDAPRFAWRGSHLDVARQFYPIGEIRDLLAIMAWNKLNRFHLHLTEDEAWRFEVAAYPELTAVGAYRGADMPIPPLLGSGPEASGGHYSKADLKALVATAGAWGMDVVPEVDVPGHSYAAIAALPKLRDPGENGEYLSIQGFPNNCLNSGVPFVREFAEAVFAELMDIFPGKWIHVGADEVPDDAWETSPAAKARLAEIGGGGWHELQADFLKRVYGQIRDAGRVVGAWEEGAHGGGIAPEGSYLVAWRNAAIGAELAAQGYDVVMSPGQAYYLDMARSTDWWEPGASWAGVSSLQHTYEFDPLDGFAKEHQGRMIGIQACIWSEPMSDRRVFRRLVFPRLSAIAETAWSQEKNRDFKRFVAVARFLPYRPLED
ncbi:beta-N-acetylhexosaminidase [Oryzibacter oryziterrae]|uniref:beta-N-acetylhexosaminidase n=1 Tax=Oryzibacter oryziterrae TaxID=2766474 RepID=UPI001F490A8C|nr:beta-N-acetylhexosaminidase [Oryzibacter oryziterrae]